MTTREHIYTCESCGAPIYAGEQFCAFYTDIVFCAEHAMKRSDELVILREAVKGGYSPYEGEVYDEALILDKIAKLELLIAREGDGPAALVKA